jgi:hypothetical protein
MREFDDGEAPSPKHLVRMPRRKPLIEKARTYSIIGSYYDVHRELGFG